ncbi:hypothetical protein AX14_003173 [Amanita brunnescens Koide BX004]|nr:hypothetical protein AX14_003173 [Amanita brunnescens Koide BX004]
MSGAQDGGSAIENASRTAVGLYALSIYEFLLVLDDERRLVREIHTCATRRPSRGSLSFPCKVYNGPWNSIKILYLFCRFLPIVSWPIVILVVTSLDKDCSIWINSQSAICLLLQFSPQCLLLLCTWAFSGKKKLLAWLFSLMVSTYFSAMIWAIATYTTVYGRRNMHAYHDDCFASLSTPTRLVTCIILGAVGMDISATAVVVYSYIRNQHIRGDLCRLFFSQAVMYVILMVVINACTASSYILESMTASVGYYMTLTVPNLLACRFILDLRRATNPTRTQISDRLSVVVRDGLDSEDIHHEL